MDPTHIRRVFCTVSKLNVYDYTTSQNGRRRRISADGGRILHRLRASQKREDQGTEKVPLEDAERTSVAE